MAGKPHCFSLGSVLFILRLDVTMYTRLLGLSVFLPQPLEHWDYGPMARPGNLPLALNGQADNGLSGWSLADVEEAYTVPELKRCLGTWFSKGVPELSASTPHRLPTPISAYLLRIKWDFGGCLSFQLFETGEEGPGWDEVEGMGKLPRKAPQSSWDAWGKAW